jgi:hypothetical protein
MNIFKYKKEVKMENIENEVKKRMNEKIKIFEDAMHNYKEDFVKWFNKMYIYTYDVHRKAYKIIQWSGNDKADGFVFYKNGNVEYYFGNMTPIKISDYDYVIMKAVQEFVK